MKTFKTMLKTELKLSLRGMDMFIFAICIPVAVIVLLGIIYGNKPAFEGADYTFLQQSFGAVSTIAIGAGGLMGLPLVVSDYRNRKILSYTCEACCNFIGGGNDLFHLCSGILSTYLHYSILFF